MSENGTPFEDLPVHEAATQEPQSRPGLRFHFSLSSLLLFTFFVGALVGPWVYHYRKFQRLARQEASTLDQADLGLMLQQLAIPDEVLYFDPNFQESKLGPDWEIATLRLQSFANHGVQQFHTFGSLQEYADASNRGSFADWALSMPDARQKSFESFEAAQYRTACEACRRLTTTPLTPPKPSRQVSSNLGKVFQLDERVRTLLLRLTTAPAQQGELSLLACSALLHLSDRSPETIAGVHRALNLPNVEVRRRWEYPAEKKVAVRLNRDFQLNLTASEKPYPAGSATPVRTLSDQLIATRSYISTPELQSVCERGALQERLQAAFMSAVHIRDVSSRSLTLEVDPVSIPNAALSDMFRLEGSAFVTQVQDRQGSCLKSAPSKSESLHSGHFQVEQSLVYLEPTHTEIESIDVVFKFPLFLEAEIFKFDLASKDFKIELEQAPVKQQQNRLTAEVKAVNRSVVSGSFHGRPLMRDDHRPAIVFFGFNESGQAMRPRYTSVSRNSPDWRVEFYEEVKQLWMALPGRKEKLEIAVHVDFADRDFAQVPLRPTPNLTARYDTSQLPDFHNLTTQQLRQLPVKYVSTGMAPGEGRAVLDVEGMPIDLRSTWHVEWFDGSGGFLVKGFAMRGTDDLLTWKPAIPSSTKPPVPKALVGKVRLQCRADFQRQTVDKQQNAKWQTLEMSGSEVQVLFDHQIVRWRAPPDLEVAIVARNSTGKSLKLGQEVETESGDHEFGFWGSPTQLELQTWRHADEKVFFEFRFQELDEDAFAEFKQRLVDREAVLTALRQIQTARKSDRRCYSSLATLHFLHDSRGKNQNLISRELAEACPVGAELFGYEVKPYHGYLFFEWIESHRTSSKLDRRQWDGGPLELQPVSPARRYYARPMDNSSPVLQFDGRTFYQKQMVDADTFAPPLGPAIPRAWERLPE